jgi:transcriptional regulator with XRE-family HTH domain
MLIGMSQEKLGELLGLTFQQVQKYEKGTNRIGASRLHQIARFLGVNVQFFFEDVAEDAPRSAAPGFAETNEAPSIMEFLSTSDGLELNRAYSKIPDPKVRKKILDLVRCLAEGNNTSASEPATRKSKTGAPVE